MQQQRVAVVDIERPDRPQREVEHDRQIVPQPGETIAHTGRGALAAGRRANGLGDGPAALQDDDDDKEMHDQHHQTQQRRIAGAMQAEQQRHVRKGDARHGDGDDAPRPDLDIHRGLGADTEQTERPRQSPHDADQPARQRVGIHHREDHEAGDGEIADPGPQQHRGDADEDQYRKQLERETSQHERQPHQRLPGARQAEVPSMPFARRGDIRGRGGRIGQRQRLRRRRCSLRNARFQQRHRPLDQAENQPFAGQGATEHQRQFPGDIEQLIIGRWIVGGPHDPVIERRKVRQRPRDIGDLVRDIADLLGNRQQKLGAEAVRCERNRVVRFGRGRRGLGLLCCLGLRRGLALRRGFGDGAQGIDHPRALGVVLQRIEGAVGLFGRQRIAAVGG